MLSVLLFASMLVSMLTTGNPLGASSAYAQTYVCTGTAFFGSAGVGTVFHEGDTHQGAIISFVQNDRVIRVREPEPGVVVGRFQLGSLEGGQATIEFNRTIRVVAILWFDNDPNPGEAGWSFNGISGPLTGNRGAILQPVDLITNVVHIDAGLDSGGIDFCFEEFAGAQGCTPGYWKQDQHYDSWVNYSPSQTLESVFDVPDSLGMDNTTLLQALQGGGGSGISGASKILLRAAVASLLNASNSSVAFPLSTANIVSVVNAALASGDRDAILALAADLDAKNNLGCPLN
jgi:hypothetical protein